MRLSAPTTRLLVVTLYLHGQSHQHHGAAQSHDKEKPPGKTCGNPRFDRAVTPTNGLPRSVRYDLYVKDTVVMFARVYYDSDMGFSAGLSFNY